MDSDGASLTVYKSMRKRIWNIKEPLLLSKLMTRVGSYSNIKAKVCDTS